MTPHIVVSPGPAHRLLAARFTAAVAGSDPAVGAAILDDLLESDLLGVMTALAVNVCQLVAVIDPEHWREGLSESVVRLTIEAEQADDR